MYLAKRVLRRFWQRKENAENVLAAQDSVSTGHTLLVGNNSATLNGWQNPSVAIRQHQAFGTLLEEARAGRPRLDFVVAAQTLKATELVNPLVIEVGCGSGYYSEVLPLLLEHSVRYIGVDYSAEMVALAHQTYSTIPFVVGDACQLPLQNECCDVLLSGTSLMHIEKYQQAIAESARVSRQWCIFHTVPVTEKRATTMLRKEAYGQPVLEVIFNQAELAKLFTEQNLSVKAIVESIPYDVSHIIGERTWTLTYLCQKTSLT